jgi:aspartyl protease family protein
LIAEYARKGQCELGYAKGSDRFPISGTGVMKVQVRVNGVSGTFIVDTGASLVSLTGDFSSRARVNTDAANRVLLQTANGTTEGALGVA